MGLEPFGSFGKYSSASSVPIPVGADDMEDTPTATGAIVRATEWRRVQDFIIEEGHSPSVLVIEGEAGAGKSTLWRYGVELAAGRGDQVLRSDPSENEYDLAFAGLSDLLAEVLPNMGPAIPPPQREALEVTMLLRSSTGVPPPPRAVGAAVLAVLRELALPKKVLVGIDDVQWFDEASLDALVFALRRFDAGPLKMLLTARSEVADPLSVGGPPPSSNWRTLLAAQPQTESMVLAPLTMSQVRGLLGSSISAREARIVAEQSRGNPFWALVLASNPTGSLASAPTYAGLQDRLSQALSPAATEALAVVAAVGRIRVVDALAVLAHVDDAEAALDAAVLAGVITENGERLAPAHPLIGAAALSMLPPGRRMSLYQRLADASPEPERYAHFAALASGPGPNTEVAEALDVAAAAAHARGANTAAAQFAVQAVDQSDETDNAAVAERHVRAGELLFLAGDLEHALERLESLDLDRLEAHQLERALPLLLDLVDVVRSASEATEIIASLVAHAPGAEMRRRALIFALAADIQYGMAGQRQSAAMEAIRCAETGGPPATAILHRALINLMAVKVIGGEGVDDALLERAELLEAEIGPLRLYDTADLHRGLWNRYVERLDESRAAMNRSIARAQEAGDDYALSVFLSYLAATEMLAGNLTEASAAIDRAQDAELWHSWTPSPFHLEPRCELLIAHGDFDRAVMLADHYLPDDAHTSYPARFMGSYVRGKVCFWRGDFSAAARHLHVAANHADRCDWADPGVRSRLDSLLAEALVNVGRAEDASEIADRLRRVGARLARQALLGDADRIEALVAAHRGDLDSAVVAAHSATAAHNASPLRVEAARSLLVLGRIQRRRRARKQSRDALNRSLVLASSIGHRPLIHEVESELERVASVRTGSELTAAELRVAELIARGASNREASEALFVSVRTVETHVAAIYRKLGVRSRSQLTQRLSELPISPDGADRP